MDLSEMGPEEGRKLAGRVVAISSAIALSAVVATGSETIRRVIDMTERERNAAFAGIVDSTPDHACAKVTHSILRGIDDEGNIYVTVRCGDGADYQLQLSDTRSGVLECSIVETIARVRCWEPFLPMEPVEGRTQ